MDRYRLELTEDDLRVLNMACEFYARVRMGQFSEIMYYCLDCQDIIGDFWERRDEAERLLFEARKYIYPELTGRGHSYGVGKFEDADRAFDIHQVVRYSLGNPRQPYDLFGRGLPKCEKKKEEN